MATSTTKASNSVAATASIRPFWKRDLPDWWPVVPGLLAMLLLGLPTLTMPFGADQSIFATIGDTINRGGYPYVDAWDQKPPGIYLLYALALRFPGELMFRVRLFDLLWTLATLAMLFVVGRRLWNARAATFAMVLWGGLYFTTQGWWYLAQPDGLMGLPLLLAFYLLLPAHKRGVWWRGGIAGGLIGLAFQLRFIAAPVIPAYVLYTAVRGLRTWRLAFWQGVAVATGFLVFQFLVLAWLARGHAIHAYLDATSFAAGYTQLGWPFSPKHPNFTEFLAHVRGSFLLFAHANFVMVAPAVIGVFAAWYFAPDERARAVSLMVAIAYLGVAAQQKFFWYHWQIICPFVGLLAGWSLDQLWRQTSRLIKGAPSRTAARITTIGALVLATPGLTDYGYAQWDDFLHRSESRLAAVRRNNAYGPYAEGPYSYLADVQVSDYLRARTTPGQRIYVFGYDPLIYLLTERPSASRFIYSLPLLSYWAPPQWTTEFLIEIDRHQPAYILVQRNEGAAHWITGQSEDTATWAFKIPGMAARLNRDYEFEIEIEDFSLYRRR